MKNAYIGVIHYFKINIVSKIGLQLDKFEHSTKKSRKDEQKTELERKWHFCLLACI